MSTLEVLYSRTSTLLRDLFQYLLPGLFLGILLILPALVPTVSPQAIAVVDALAETARDSTLLALGLLAGVVALLYIVGHLLFGLSKPALSFVDSLADHLPVLGRDDGESGFGTDDQLGREISVFWKAPDVHGRFIERYNGLLYFRQGLLGSLLVATVYYLVLLSADGLDPWTLSLAVAMLPLSAVVYGQYRSTRREFSRRVGISARTVGAEADLGPALYFAYGSNMSEEQMRSRCPSAVFVTVARLERYRLTFPRKSDRWGGGVAGLMESKADHVEGVVYSLSREDLHALDAYEGTSQRRYLRERVEVVDAEGKEYDTWTYFAQPQRGAPFPPSEDYRDTLVRGAEEHRLSAEYRKWLAESL